MLEQAKQQSPFFRKLFGSMALFTGIVMAFISGFTFYEIDLGITIAVLGTGTTLLGIGNVTDIWKP